MCRDEARVDAADTGLRGGLSGFSREAVEEIRRSIRAKYGEVAVSASGKFSYPTGKEGAVALGYDPSVIDSLDPSSLESFCGVGNPFSLGPVRPGEAVLDYGCGAGLDLIVAGILTGPGGRVVGVDLTEEMVGKAGLNAARAGLLNVETVRVFSEELPFDDETFDLVTSNGVINLSPSKQKCFSEIFRVLKKGGRLRFADVVREDEAPAAFGGGVEAWSQ